MSNEYVNSPPHYKSDNGVECIDAIVGALGVEGALHYCRGAALKYLWRCMSKGGSDDLLKAHWYVEYAHDLMLAIESAD